MSDLTAPVLSHHFTGLIGRSVSFTRVPPRRESQLRQVFGVYTNTSSAAPVILKSDLSLMGAFAGALVGLPGSEVRERIRGPEIEEILRDAIYEVLNVASSVIVAEGRTTLVSMATDLTQIGSEAQSLVAKPNHRIDFDVSLNDDDGGRFTVLS
jgi:hypothetical protein